MSSEVTAATQARDQALATVLAGAEHDHRASIEDALRVVVEQGGEFTTDSVIRAMGDLYRELPEPRLIGAVLQIWRRRGLIEPSGRYVQSTRRECHARPVMVWRVQP